jgi:hypothetical protein
MARSAHSRPSPFGKLRVRDYSKNLILRPPKDERDRRRGTKEAKSLTHNYIAEGGAKWIEAIEKSEISEESRPYP